MVVTDRTPAWRLMSQYKDHGKPPEARQSQTAPSVKRRWIHDTFGSNLRMTCMQAEIGRIMLRRLSRWRDVRRRNADRISAVCSALQVLRTAVPPKDVKHANYKFYTFVRTERLAKDWTRNRIAEEITACGVPCYSGTCSEIYLEKAFPPAWRPDRYLPVARQLGETSLMFLVHPTLTEENLIATENAIRQVCSRATAGESSTELSSSGTTVAVEAAGSMIDESHRVEGNVLSSPGVMNPNQVWNHGWNKRIYS